jgi:type I restriction enzyme S subunit
VSSFDGGKSFAGEDDDDLHAPYRVLRVSAVTSGEFRPEESRPVPRGYTPPSRHRVRLGDLLISRANTSALVGAVALVDDASDELLLPDKIWRFSWRDGEAAVPEFVWQLFRTRAVRSAISRRSTGTSGSMKNISAEKLMGIEVIQPPVRRQLEFAGVFRHTRRLRAHAARQLTHLDALFASLQHRAFTGTL